MSTPQIQADLTDPHPPSLVTRDWQFSRKFDAHQWIARQKGRLTLCALKA
jgi:hypothetical protein